MLIYLCDDSESDMLRLKHYLDKYAEQAKLHFELVSFSCAEEMLTAFKQTARQPELLFLDIYMSTLNGMEAARQLRNMHYQGGIILTTSSTEHAMASYEINALYYLQKPYDRRNFENAMARCGSLLLKARPCYTFTQKKKEISVPYENIIFFETRPSHIIVLHTTSGSYSFYGTLTRVMDQFRNTDVFLPAGRSFLINLEHVSAQNANDLIMSDGSIVQIPFRKQPEILAAVKRYRGPSPESPPFMR